MTPIIVTSLGAAAVVVAAFLVDFRLGLATFGTLLLVLGLLVDFGDES